MTGAVPAALGTLAELLTPGVTDVLVNGPGRVWVDGPGGLRRVSVDGLDTETRVRSLAIGLAAAGGRRLDEASPWVDARLPGGLRVHAVLSALCPGGTHISLRVAESTPLSLADLVSRGTLSPVTAETLVRLVAARRPLLVTGPTGAGKTTVLGALLAAVPAGQRIVCVEDSQELRPDHPHVVSLEARPGNAEGAGGVGLAVLVRQALRMRPDWLVVGECRGPEIRELLLALGTGHAGASTLHARSAADVPLRVTALAGTAGIGRAAALAQLRVGVDAVVPLRKLGDGQRVVDGIWVWVGGRLVCGVDGAGRDGPAAEELAGAVSGW